MKRAINSRDFATTTAKMFHKRSSQNYDLYRHVKPVDEFDAGMVSIEYTPKYKKFMDTDHHAENLLLNPAANTIGDRGKPVRKIPSFDPQKARKMFEKANKNWLMLRKKSSKGPAPGVDNTLTDQLDMKTKTSGSEGGKPGNM